MQYMLPLIIAVVLGALALAFVLYPFYRRAPARSEQQKSSASFPWMEEEELERANGNGSERAAPQGAGMLSESEQAARSALHEIELDYQLGNISESDYRAMRERYLQRALVALKSRYDREQLLDDTIEAQLQEMKKHDDGME